MGSNESRRLRRQKWAAQGLCTRCGKNPARPGCKTCETCTEELKKWNSYKKVEPLVPQRLRSVPDKWPYGWCYVCCQPTGDKRTKLCDKHKNWIFTKKKAGDYA